MRVASATAPLPVQAPAPRRPLPDTLWRRRYLVLGPWTLGWFLAAFSRLGPGGPTDWWIFESAGRIIDGSAPYAHSGVLEVYSKQPYIQIGPPPLLVSAAIQPLPPRVEEWIGGLLMLGLAVVTVALVEAAASALGHAPTSTRGRLLQCAGAAVVLAVLADGVGGHRHLDDIMALAGMAGALLALARVRAGATAAGGSSTRAWWVGAALLGCAAACKPWAVVFVPLLLVLPRALRARAVGVAIVSCAVWWLPFVLGAPGTVSALGGYHILPAAGSIPRLLGLTGDLSGWLRPVQLGAAAAVGALCAWRGRWLLAPAAALAVRVLFDPYVWTYYGMGPVLAAFLVDITRRPRRLPVWTASVALVEYAVPAVFGPAATASIRLAMVVVALVATGAAVLGRPRASGRAALR